MSEAELRLECLRIALSASLTRGSTSASNLAAEAEILFSHIQQTTPKGKDATLKPAGDFEVHLEGKVIRVSRGWLMP